MSSLSTHPSNHKKLIDILLDKSLSPKVRSSALQHSPDPFICFMCACFHNLVHGALSIKEGNHFKRLKKHKTLIKNIANPQQTAGQKRKVLVKAIRGNEKILTGLIPFIITLVLEYFENE